MLDTFSLSTGTGTKTNAPHHQTIHHIGDVKVFDFGLARDLNPKLKTKGGMYKLTGRTGSFPYMAPGEYYFGFRLG